MKNRITASFTQTIKSVVRALSLTPITNTPVTSSTMIAAGRFSTPPSGPPGA